LLVENLERHYGPITRWLSEKGYQVRVAKSYDEALLALDDGHYHLAIVDIRLEDEDEDNKQGIELLDEFEKKRLNDVMPCIMLTAHANVDNILEATQKYEVAKYIQKNPSGYRSELLNAVRELFEEEIQINFDLIYDGNSDKLIPNIADHINWSAESRPQSHLLPPQVWDLFGKLFVKAKRAYLSKLNPGLTGTAVVRAQPTWEHGLGPSYVAKVGPREKIERESKNYETFVSQYLPHGTVTRVNATCTRHIGAILYTFAAGGQEEPLDEFDKFYECNQSDAIVASLRNLFQNTCRYWYDRRERAFENLPQLYYEAFQLEQEKLVGRIQVVLPCFDPRHETFQFDQVPVEATNPIAWLARHQDECILPVYHSITHGDLTGRNIMVNESGSCWLIDFYRTYNSHILRDFIILETDIKYRLLPTPDWKDFFALEKTLLQTAQAQSPPNLESLPADVQKAARIVIALRDMAYQFSRGPGTRHQVGRQEYLISLLMGTLNVARLRHVEEDRKLQAMLSATMICVELDELAGREPFRPNFDDDQKPIKPQPTLQTTAQQRCLTAQLNSGNLILFIGSANPPGTDWPTLEALARQLMQKAGYDLPPGDSPGEMLATYGDKVGLGRECLIDKLIQYFESHPPPPLFEQVTAFPWRAVYTTNQHTYLEQAFEKGEQAQCEVIVSPTQRMDALADKMPIYKICGCLSQEHRHDPPTTLPITDYDHRDAKTQARIKRFVDRLEQDLVAGKSLLVLHPSEMELDMAHRWCQSAKGKGLIWITGTNFSEEDQDYYRHLGFRVLPDDPPDLFSVFSELLQS